MASSQLGSGQPRAAGAGTLREPSPGRMAGRAVAQGIVVVDLASGRIALLATPPDVTTAQIDGLYEWRGSLVAVQAAPSLERVVRVLRLPLHETPH